MNFPQTPILSFLTSWHLLAGGARARKAELAALREQIDKNKRNGRDALRRGGKFISPLLSS